MIGSTRSSDCLISALNAELTTYDWSAYNEEGKWYYAFSFESSHMPETSVTKNDGSPLSAGLAPAEFCYPEWSSSGLTTCNGIHHFRHEKSYDEETTFSREPWFKCEVYFNSYASPEEFEYLINPEYPTIGTFMVGGSVEFYSPDEALYVCQESIESVRTAFYFREELEIDVEPFVEEINQA